MVKIRFVYQLDISADELAARLLALSATERVCILDSCGVAYLGSHLLIAGIGPSEIIEFSSNDINETLTLLDQYLSGERSAIFTISYEFGLKLQGLKKRDKEIATPDEPDLFLAPFECLVVHDYNTRKTFLVGNEAKFRSTEKLLKDAPILNTSVSSPTSVSSNFTSTQYLRAIDEIKELIRSGDTYQTNLTQRFEIKTDQSPQEIFVAFKSSIRHLLQHLFSVRRRR